MKRYKCVLLDDELLGLSLLRSMCESIPEIEVVRAFNDPVQFLAQSEEIDFDFYFSDIVMPLQNGIDVKSNLIDKPVIFCSAHPQFAIDAFDLAAIDFLKKPVTLERLRIAVQKVIEKLKSLEEQKVWLVQTSSGRQSIQSGSIVAISTSEIDARDKIVFLADQSELLLKNKSFRQIIEDLGHLKLVRTTKTTSVNLRYISGYNGDRILFSANWKAAPELTQRLQHLSEAYKRDFVKEFEQQ